jgi:hypothetical protein
MLRALTLTTENPPRSSFAKEEVAGELGGKMRS